jgi:hypothetical protein
VQSVEQQAKLCMLPLHTSMRVNFRMFSFALANFKGIHELLSRHEYWLQAWKLRKVLKGS